MGTFRSTYVSPHAQSIAARIRVAPTAVKATRQPVSVGPAPLAPDARESRVSHAIVKDPTAAARRARWRKKNPEQHAIQQRAARARRKAVAA
jgi:hypothetical protein